MIGPVPKTSHSRRTSSATQRRTTISTLTKGISPLTMRDIVEIPTSASEPVCRSDRPRAFAVACTLAPSARRSKEATTHTVARRQYHGIESCPTILIRIDPNQDHIARDHLRSPPQSWQNATIAQPNRPRIRQTLVTRGERLPPSSVHSTSAPAQAANTLPDKGERSREVQMSIGPSSGGVGVCSFGVSS